MPPTKNPSNQNNLPKQIDDTHQQKPKNKIRLSTDGRIQTEGFFPTNGKLTNVSLTSDEFINYLHCINKSMIKIPQNCIPQPQNSKKQINNQEVYIQSNDFQNSFIKTSNPKQAMIIPQMAQFMVSNNLPQSVSNSNSNKVQTQNTLKFNSTNEIAFIKSPLQQDCIDLQTTQDSSFQNSSNPKGNSLSSTSSSSQQNGYSQFDDEKGKPLFTPEKSAAGQGVKKNFYYPQNHRSYQKAKRGSSHFIGSSTNLSYQNNITLPEQNSIPACKRYDFNYQKIIFDNSGNNLNKKYGKILPATHNPDYRFLLDLDNSQNILNYYMRKNFSGSNNEVTESGKNLMISSLLTRNQTVRQTIEQYSFNYQHKFPEKAKKSSSQATIHFITGPASDVKERKIPSSAHQKKRRNSGLISLSQTTPIQQMLLARNSVQCQPSGIVEVSQGNQCVAVFQNLNQIKNVNQSQERVGENIHQNISSQKKSNIKINNLNRTVDFDQEQPIQINKLISIEDKSTYFQSDTKNNRKMGHPHSSSREDKYNSQNQDQESQVKPKCYDLQFDKMNKILNYNQHPYTYKRPSTSFQNYNDTIIKQSDYRKPINCNSSQDNINVSQIPHVQTQVLNTKIIKFPNQQQQQQINQNSSPLPRQHPNLLRPSLDLSSGKQHITVQLHQKQQQQQQSHSQQQNYQSNNEQTQAVKTSAFIKNPPLIPQQNQGNSLSVNSRPILYNYKQTCITQQAQQQRNSSNQASSGGKQRFNTEVSNSQSLEREIQISYFSNKKNRRRTNSQLNNENLFSMSKQDTINISITNMNQITEFSNQVTTKSGSKPSSQNNKNISYSKQLMQIQNLQQNSINIIPMFSNPEIMNKLEHSQPQQKESTPIIGSINSNVNNYNKILSKVTYR